MKNAGCTKVAVANDKEAYGAGLATLLELQKAKYGITITSNTGIDPTAPNFRSYASTIKSQGADCFVFAGIVANGGVQITKDVAAAIPGVKIFGPDGMCTSTWTNPKMGGVPLSLAPQIQCTVATQDLSAYPGGKTFLAAYQAAYHSVPDPYAIYGYEAMKLGLDTIASLGCQGRTTRPTSCPRCSRRSRATRSSGRTGSTPTATRPSRPTACTRSERTGIPCSTRRSRRAPDRRHGSTARREGGVRAPSRGRGPPEGECSDVEATAAPCSAVVPGAETGRHRCAVAPGPGDFRSRSRSCPSSTRCRTSSTATRSRSTASRSSTTTSPRSGRTSSRASPTARSGRSSRSATRSSTGSSS